MITPTPESVSCHRRRATGKNTLIMAGVWTSVCVKFPALDAEAVGFKVLP
jgi:nicotinamidase-related amidase